MARSLPPLWVESFCRSRSKAPVTAIPQRSGFPVPGPTARVRESTSFRMSMLVDSSISSRAAKGVRSRVPSDQLSARGLDATDFRSTYPMRLAPWGTKPREGPMDPLWALTRSAAK
jgi:hypothetical protein